MAVTPQFYLTGSGDTLSLEYVDGTDAALANAYAVLIDDELWIVTADELPSLLPGWQHASALDLARIIAGMPKVGS